MHLHFVYAFHGTNEGAGVEAAPLVSARGKDRIIAPATQAFMAGRAKAYVESVTSTTRTTSAPVEVTRMIQEAVRASV